MLDLLIIVLYFIALLVIGWSRRGQSSDTFLIAGRRGSATKITLSLVATIFGASSTIGIIGLGYSRGLTGAWWALIGGIALIPFGLFLAAKVRAQRSITLPDILNRAYGNRVSIPAGLMISIAWCGIIAAQLIAGGRLISEVFSFDFQISLIIITAIFITYTFWGGQLSVVKTDSWQFGLFIFGVIVAGLYLLFNIELSSIPKEKLSFPVSEQFSWYQLLVFYPLIVGLPYLAGPDIYSRALCANDEKVAKRSSLIASGVVIILSLVLALIGILALVKFPGLKPEQALPVTLSELLPAGLKGIIVAGFLGAIMSSADTCLISASTILSRNVISPIFKLSNEREFVNTKIGIIIIGIVSLLIASQEQGIITSLLLGYTVFVGGVVLPTLGSFYKKRLCLTSTGAMWAVIVGGMVAIFGKVADGVVIKSLLTERGLAFLKTILGTQALSILPLALSMIVLFVVSRISKSRL